MGGLGYPFATVGRVVTALPDDVRGLLVGCSALCNTMGFAALAIFTWRVFRPGSRLVEVLVAACLTALALLVPAEAVWPGLVESALSVEPYPGAAGLPARGGRPRRSSTGRALEASLFGRQLERRLAIGLADAVVTDRRAASGRSRWRAPRSATPRVRARRFLGIDLPASPLGAAMRSASSASSRPRSAWLAFLPPAVYLHRVRTRAAMALAAT